MTENQLMDVVAERETMYALHEMLHAVPIGDDDGAEEMIPASRIEVS